MRHITKQGFTLIELALAIAIVAIVAIIAFEKMIDLRTNAVAASEKSVAGSVTTGILLYRTQSTTYGRTPLYPATLDSANIGPASQSNILFGTVLTQGMQSEWTKNASDRYTGPANGVYQYDSTTGNFQLIGSLGLFSSFDTDSSGWATVGGKVAVQGGRFVFGPTGNNRAYSGDASWTNYAIDTQATLSSNAPYNLLFRLDSANNPSGYAFQYDPTLNSGAGGFVMRSWNNGNPSTIFASSSAPSGFQWTGTDHAVRLTVEGNAYTAYVDGQQVLTGTNSSHTSGRVGISVSSASASFDNYQVTLVP